MFRRAGAPVPLQVLVGGEGRSRTSGPQAGSSWARPAKQPERSSALDAGEDQTATHGGLVGKERTGAPPAQVPHDCQGIHSFLAPPRPLCRCRSALPDGQMAIRG